MDQQLKAIIIFVIGIVAFGLFVWYFAAEQDRKKRLVGTMLALLLVGFGAYTVGFEKMQKGIDLAGGAAFRVKIAPTEGKTVSRQDAESAKEIIEKRLAPLGNKDIVVTVQGEDEIYVEVPGIDPKQIEENRAIIERVAKLEFKLVHPQSKSLIDSRGDATWDESKKQFVGVIEPSWDELPMKESEPDDPAAVKKKPEVNPEDAKLTRDEQEKKRLEQVYKDRKTIVVKHTPELSGKSVKQAWPAAEPGSANYMIHVKLREGSKDAKEDYGDQMAQITKKNLGRPLAIVVDNEVISAPSIQGEFGADFQITGKFTLQEATDLSGALMNPLENPLKIVQASQTSPTYGDAIIKQGIMAGIAGLIATLIFMCIYYRLAGLIAVFGLAVNLLLLLAAMVIFDFTLTMPGIAGILLTLGIAVDANVLIYERMREEFRAGKTLGGAIKASYEKAFTAIFDSNLTSLITSVIMILLATGAVKGFGVTLTVGILASLFSSLLITRVCFSWLEGAGLKSLSFMSLIKNQFINFMGQRKVAMTLSFGLSTIALIFLIMKGQKSLGYELRGGELISLQGVTEEQVVSSLKNLHSAQAEDGKTEEFSFTTQTVQPLGDASAYINVRTNFGHGDDAISQLEKDLKIDIKASDLQQIGPAIGSQMLKDSIWAVLWGLVGIFVYLAFRYEVPFALGGIIALTHDVIIVAGICALAGREIGMILIGAFLTIAGYSINDTIVIFDRIRETLRNSREDLEHVMNEAISATLSRTILTSGVTLIVVISMYLFGGSAMADFSFAMLIGIVIGTYSSIFVASPIVLWWAKKWNLNLRKVILDADLAKIQAQSNLEREVVKPEPKSKAKPSKA